MIITNRTVIVVAVLFLGVFWSASGQAFRRIPLGTEVPNIELKTLDGERHELFQPNTKVYLFVFFRPNQKYSQSTLGILAPICDAYGKRSVRCVAIVSDYYDKATIKTAVKAAHWSDKKTFIDEEDRYSAQLGVILYPSIGITDGSRKLQAYEPFVKVNYAQRIEATIRFLLGDINEKQLQNALAPPLHEQETQDRDTALLNYNFARKLFELGENETAVARAKRALELNPDLADAHALIGLIRVKQRRCDEAIIQFQKALQLDKKNKQATKGMARCK